MSTLKTYSKPQLNVLVILRMLIGWHFLYEGMAKLWNPGWSAGGYLADSGWIFGGLFRALAANSTLLSVADTVTIWGLILIGLFLIAGFMSRYAALGGIVLLGMFYLSHPPLIGTSYALPAEGNTLIVNKNLIEIFALAVVMLFPTSHIIGLDGLLAKMRGQQESEGDVEERELVMER